jgi:ABC-type transport system substrate-binding protein
MTTHRGKAIAALLVPLVLTAALAGALAKGAATASTPSPSPAAGGATLRIGWTADPDNLSPFIGVETAASEVLALT